jgi:uncharacterized RDD family membrane protein YckC
MSGKMIPLEIEGINDNIYSGFWPRLGANLIDGLIFMPYSFLLLFINSFNKYAYLFTVIPNLLFIFWFDVYLPKKYAGTPGKLIVGIKIVKMDSSPIGWRESFLRSSINIVFSIINIITMIIAVLLVDDKIYSNLGWFQKTAYLSSIFKDNTIGILNNVWVWSEVIVLLFNKRKRALHDFIAGTVIIKSEYIEQIRNRMKE